MSYIEVKSEVINHLKTSIQNFKQLIKENDFSKEKFISSNQQFLGAEKLIEDYIHLVNSMEDISFEIQPSTLTRKLLANIQGAIDDIVFLKTNLLPVGDIGIINQLSERILAFDSKLTTLLELIIYLNIKNNDYSERENLLRKQLKNIENMTNDAEYNIEKLLLANKIKTYAKTAKKYKKSSKLFLWTTIVSVLMIIGFALWAFYDVDKQVLELSVHAIIYKTIQKVSIFLILYLVIYSMFKIYKSLKHNEITNRHKSNSLSTYKLMLEAIDDRAGKNEIMIEIVKAILSHQPSGFVEEKSDITANLPILDFLKKLNK